MLEESLPDGFRIVLDDNEVIVKLEGQAFRIDCPNEIYEYLPFYLDDIEGKSSDPVEQIVSVRVGLPHYYRLIDEIAGHLNYNWKSKKDAHWDIYGWRKKKVGRMFGKFVHGEWLRLLEQADPLALQVQKRVFGQTFHIPHILFEPEIYNEKYIISDLFNYRAACHALQMLTYYSNQLGNMRDWLGFLADSPAKRRTLMNLPGNIPTWIVEHITNTYLYQTVTERLPLILSLASSFQPGQLHDPILQRATTAQVKEGFRRWARTTHEPEGIRKVSAIHRYAIFLNDYPDHHNGNLIGLTDKAIRWHRDIELRRNEMQLAQLERAGKIVMAKPPLPLPELPEIKFLETARDLMEEGERMGHCVAAYADQAAKGRSFLFHVERNGVGATVEVKSDGFVSQAYGPHNRENGAARWGKRVLSEWAKEFRHEEIIEHW